MAGATVRFTGNVDGLKRLSVRLARLGNQQVLAAAARELGDESLRLVQDGFERGRSPHGQKWRRPRGRPGGRPLLDTGRLRASITTRTRGRMGFEIGTNAIYGAVHQYGATIRPKRAKYLAFRTGGVRGGKTQRRGGKLGKGESWVFAKQVTIPARPYLPDEGAMPGPWLRPLSAVLRDFVEEMLAGGRP